jgi:cbb3-type cytochrome oxidase maturation protein
MSVIVLLIAAGGAVAVGFLGAFFWAVRSGQFDDTHTPAIRVLFDDLNNVNDALPRARATAVDRHLRPR